MPPPPLHTHGCLCHPTGLARLGSARLEVGECHLVLRGNFSPQQVPAALLKGWGEPGGGENSAPILGRRERSSSPLDQDHIRGVGRRERENRCCRCISSCIQKRLLFAFQLQRSLRLQPEKKEKDDVRVDKLPLYNSLIPM